MKNKRGNVFTVLLIQLFVVSVTISLMALWTERNLEYYLSLFKGVEVDLPYWLCFVITGLFNVVALGFNVLAEVIKYLL